MALSVEILVGHQGWERDVTELEALTIQVLNRVAVELKLPDAELSVCFADDTHITQLNTQFRGKEKPTNILSFQQYDDLEELRAAEEPVYLGDLILAYETIKNESNEQDKSFQHHVTHLLIHGFLHLCGFDHEVEDQANEMEGFEIQILSKLGIENPYETR